VSSRVDLGGRRIIKKDGEDTYILHYRGTLEVVKTGPGSAHHGDQVTYWFAVTYTSSDGAPAKNIVVVDDIYGTATYHSGDDGDDLLEIGETWMYYVNGIFLETHTNDEIDPVTNTVTADGEDFDGDDLDDAEDTHDTNILHYEGILDIIKTGPDYAYHGETVTYWFAVTYTSSDGAPAQNIVVVDDVYGPATYSSGDDGDWLLEIGETWMYYVTGTYMDTHSNDEPCSILNTVTVDGDDFDGDDLDDAQDDHRTCVRHYEGTLNIVKTGPDYAYHGETVTYWFAVTYTSPDGAPAKNIVVIDDVYGQATYDSGDDGDGLLEIGETWMYYVIGTYPETHSNDEPCSIVNTVTVDGDDFDGDDLDDAQDDHRTCVRHYEGTLEVIKSGPDTAYHGEQVTYWFHVTYSSPDNAPAKNIVVVDDIYGTANYHSGDDGDGLLEFDETWVYYVTGTFLEIHDNNEADKVTNTVTADGEDFDGDDLDEDTDTHDTYIRHYEGTLEVVKSGPETAYHGETVTYWFAVTYTSPDGAPAKNIVVVDDTYGPATYDSGDDGDNLLEIGETWMYYVTGTFLAIHSNVETDPVVNTVTVDGEDFDGDDLEDAEDTHETDILHHEGTLSVVKTGPSVAHHGDSVTYWFAVTYTSSDGAPAKNIAVVDDIYGTATYSSGDDGDDLLEIGETWMYYVTGSISPTHDDAEDDPITDTVTVDGEDFDGDDLDDATDDHDTDILHPAIQVTKDADKDVAHVTETVTYTITVSNIGDTTLYNVVLTDPLIGWTSNPITLDVGESHTFYVDYVVTGSECDPFTNCVTATGEDEIGGDRGTVTDEDCETVDIIHPEIEVIKSADTKYVYQGETKTITYFFTVRNIGDVPLYNVQVIDDILGDLTSNLPDTTLDVGEENTFSVAYTHTFAEDECGLTNVVTASGVDDWGWPVSDTDTWTVVALPLSQVTDTSFCVFDKDPDTPGQQFRLLFTQNPHNPGTYKLTSSNPGQWYYNVFYLGTEGEEITLDITIPYPFVTQGAVPTHAYADAGYGRCGCFKQYNGLDDITVTGTDSVSPSGELIIELDDHVDGSVTVSVTATVPETGLVYVTIHLDFGLKKWRDFQRTGSNGADHPDDMNDIPDYNDYWFSVAGDMTDSQVVQNMNVFKKNPGFGGIVVDSLGNPIPYATVQIYGPDGKLIGTTVTDSDGYWYFWWKHTGKEQVYKVKIPMFGQEVYVPLKSNKFAEVNFVI
jgi:uncharacterized repeat protein (TIGR01451 family)